MTPVPLDLPLRPAEAAELGILIFEQAERKPLTDDVRNRIAARAAVLRLETIRPYFGSLERDPVHPSAYYLAVDGEKGEPLLLYLALATAPTSSIFYKPLLIGRMRRPNGPEMVINSVPFGPFDHDNLEKFAARLNTAFSPRPQGSRTAIAVETRHPETDLPCAFEAFRTILKRTGKNLAALLVPPSGIAARDFYSAGLWAAIRAGWREGYSSGATITAAAETLDAAREAIRSASAFSVFRVDASCFFGRAADALGNAHFEESFAGAFTAEERGWMFDEFARRFDLGDATYTFSDTEIPRLALKFGRSLKIGEQLHEAIRQTRSVLKTGRSFDFELSLEEAGGATTAAELLFCLHWLKARGHAAQLAAPALAAPVGLAAQLKELAAAARHYQATLSIRDPQDSPETLEIIARATVGRVNFKVSGEADAAARINLFAERLIG